MTEQLPKLNDKSTKTVILAAYGKALAVIQELESGKMNPQAELTAKAVAEVIASADDVSAKGIIEENIAGLKKKLGSVLDGIGGSISEQLKAYADVQEAIKAKEETLKELFGLEAESFALVALVNAKEEIARDYEDKLSQRKSDGEAELQAIYNQAKETRYKLHTEIQEEKAAAQKERKREEESYKYETTRKRQQETDAFSDELATKKREFNDTCEAFTKTLNAREVALVEREEAVAEVEAKVDELEATISHLNETMSTNIEEAVKQAKSDESSKFYREKSFIEKEAKHAVEIIESKFNSQQEALNKANATIDSLTDKLEKAYAEVRDIAKSTVENAGNQKVISQLERMVQGQSVQNSK